MGSPNGSPAASAPPTGSATTIFDDSNLAGVSSLIYHIATRADWERARADGEYTRSSVDKTLAEEGFIHASQASQVARTANKFYRDVPGDLVLLVIDPGLLRAEVRYEDVPGAELPFPHIYGPLNVDAVVDVRPFAAGPDGTFAFTDRAVTASGNA